MAKTAWSRPPTGPGRGRTATPANAAGLGARGDRSRVIRLRGLAGGSGDFCAAERVQAWGSKRTSGSAPEMLGCTTQLGWSLEARFLRIELRQDCFQGRQPRRQRVAIFTDRALKEMRQAQSFSSSARSSVSIVLMLVCLDRIGSLADNEKRLSNWRASTNTRSKCDRWSEHAAPVENGRRTFDRVCRRRGGRLHSS
jgi:hypothetical protein